jgi:hypothetical protein
MTVHLPPPVARFRARAFASRCSRLWHHASVIRTVNATRYVTPLREGGSLPAVVEADDEGMYVLKFRGAGQGPKVLVAELLAGEIARALDLPLPEIVLMELDADLARTEPDLEIQALIRASAGLNLALDFLPGAAMFDAIAERPGPVLASSIVWFDAYVSNVDRTARNANLLVWHRQLQLIDHGAALYFQHSWDGSDRSQDPFPRTKDHILLPFAGALREVDAVLAGRLTPQVIADITSLVPQDWLGDNSRDAYTQHLTRRLTTPRAFLEEAIRAHAQLV